MAIPTYDQFIGPLLSYLSEQANPTRTGAVYEAIAARIGLTDTEKAELIPSKAQPVYKNRIGWAHDALKRAQLSSSPRRGMWLLTESGRELARKHPAGLPPEECNRIANLDRQTPIKVILGQAKPDESFAEEAKLSQSPQEQVDAGLRAIRQSTAQELLEAITRGSALFFEQLVLDVLHAMGYGESKDDIQHVGRAGDGGIDGVISLDRLGLEKVYVQAKKWQGQVGSPDVQGFMGALQLQGASKGVLITSGSISGPAWEAAKHALGSVVLIDGDRLTELMIDHGVAVSHDVVKIPKIDIDYFEEE